MISGEQVAKCVSISVKKVRPKHRSKLGLDLEYAIRLFLQAHDEFILHRAWAGFALAHPPESRKAFPPNAGTPNDF